MKRLRFLGAAGTVTGSCYFLQTDDKPGVVIDCGMFQGTKEIEALNQQDLKINVESIGAVVLTHAHLDHCGRLPILTKRGYKGPFYMTEASRDLIQIVLFDAVRIAETDPEKTPLYSENDVLSLLDQTEIVDYGQPFHASHYSVLMKDAGHILGSTSLEFTDNQDQSIRKIIFSGDLGNSPQEIVRPTEMFDEADMVIMESTYGGKTHPDDDPDTALLEEINMIEETGGTLLIPSFAIQRTQEILCRIRRLKANARVKAQTPVFLDSPMATKVTSVYTSYPELYNQDFLKSGSVNNFEFSNLHVIQRHSDTKKMRAAKGARVIIAGSGMMSGGRIVRHAAQMLPIKTTRLLMVGYQGDETLGRYITEGVNPVKIAEQMIPIRANVRHVRSMSAHADEPKLLKWLKNIQGVRKVILTHGDIEPREALKQSIIRDIGEKDFVLPMINEEVVL